MNHATWMLLFAMSTARAADEVHLKGGVVVQGIVEERDGRIVVTNENGSMAYLPDHIERIDRTKPSRIQEFERRRSATNLTCAADVAALQQWALANGMPTQAAELNRQLFALFRAEVDEADAASWERLAAWAGSHGFPEAAGEALQRIFRLKIERVSDPDLLEDAVVWAEHRGICPRECREILERLLERKRAQAVNADQTYDLALWAHHHELENDAQALHRKVVALQPDHEGSRRALGFERYEGRWMTPDEVCAARGLIRFEDNWVTPDERDTVLARRQLERERQAVEQERARLAVERAALDQEQARAAEEAERRWNEIQVRQAELKVREDQIERELAKLRQYYFRQALLNRRDGFRRFDVSFGR